MADLVAAGRGPRIRSFDVSHPRSSRRGRNIAARASTTATASSSATSSTSRLPGGSQGATSSPTRPTSPPRPEHLDAELSGAPYGNERCWRCSRPTTTTSSARSQLLRPAATLATAADLGRRVANFLAIDLDFGTYAASPRSWPRSGGSAPRAAAGPTRTATWSPSTLFARTPAISGDRAAQLLLQPAALTLSATAAGVAGQPELGAARGRGGPPRGSRERAPAPTTPAGTRSRVSSSSEAYRPRAACAASHGSIGPGGAGPSLISSASASSAPPGSRARAPAACAIRGRPGPSGHAVGGLGAAHRRPPRRRNCPRPRPPIPPPDGGGRHQQGRARRRMGSSTTPP